MKRIFYLGGILMFVLSACTKDTIVGSGEPVSEFREIPVFTKLSSEGVFEVTITQGDFQSVEITADDNVIGRVKTGVEDNELKLYLDDRNYKDISLKANIVVERINGIKNSGVGNIVVSNVSESGSFRIYNSGTGNIRLEGIAGGLSVENEGSGKIKCFQFEVDNSDIQIIGSGDCEVHSTNTLNVDIEGSGNVYYKGQPLIETNISGSGKVINAN